MIECLTIGTWEARVDGKAPPAALTWRKNFSLLVYLARSPKRTRTRDQLIGLLWADKPDAKSRRSLNVALSTLRQCLGDAGITTESDRVRLAPGVVQLDIDRFEQLVRVGDLKSAADFFPSGGHFTFLEGLVVSDAPEFENWLTSERAAVAARAVDVLTRRSTELLDLGRIREAHDLAARALAVDELYEPALRAAMRARATGQDRSGALTLQEQFRARLRERLGAAPDAETEALASRLKRDWAPPAAKAAPHVPASEPARRAPLEERAEALEHLLLAWKICRSQPCRTVLLVDGDPGMGKTRLMTEFGARARVDGAIVLEVRAVEADLASPWSGVRALCHGGLLSAPGATGAAPAALATLRDELGRAAALGAALDEVVQAITDEQPLVMLLDDAHWLDRESLLALLATVRDPRSAPLVLVLATTQEPPPRPEIEDVRARIGRDIAGTAVRLGPLPFAAIRRMARWTLPLDNGAAADEQLERVARRVLADSAGIPLLAVALLDAVAVGLELDDERAGWPRPGQTLDHTFPGDLPANVVGAIRVMFGRASADAQRLLVALAVLGNRVPRAALERASELDKEKLTAALAELEWKQWIAAEPRGYAFVARILGEVVSRDMVTEGERLRIREMVSR